MWSRCATISNMQNLVPIRFYCFFHKSKMYLRPILLLFVSLWIVIWGEDNFDCGVLLTAFHSPIKVCFTAGLWSILLCSTNQVSESEIIFFHIKSNQNQHSVSEFSRSLSMMSNIYLHILSKWLICWCHLLYLLFHQWIVFLLSRS